MLLMPNLACHACNVYSGAGIDAVENELGELWHLRRGLAEDQACLRLHQVLETYTDVTRFHP